MVSPDVLLLREARPVRRQLGQPRKGEEPSSPVSSSPSRLNECLRPTTEGSECNIVAELTTTERQLAIVIPVVLALRGLAMRRPDVPTRSEPMA
jgi:hypothetical protein